MEEIRTPDNGDVNMPGEGTPPEHENAPEEKNPLADVYTILHDLVYILAAITLVFVFFARFVRVDGASMLPTLQNGDYLALQSNFIMGDLEQGDIIVARKQSFRDGEPIVKRVIATEGDTVDVVYHDDGTGTVYVNGVALSEEYINEEMVCPTYNQITFPLTVDKNCVFVMGDNRNHSADSRYVQIGQIDRSQILGRVVAILFPGSEEGGAGRDYSRIGAVS